ncbi:MAG: GMC family oxidoreductase [Gaiellales bacterium]
MRLDAEVVVVGGGSAGAAVAGCLVEAGRNVLLVEAGPDYGPFGDPRWPGDLVDARALALSHDWGYGEGRWTFERARVIGGCSSHNGAIAAVGHRSDYDGWGLPGWTGADVEQSYARVVERMRVRTYDRSEAVPFHEHCLVAAEALGWRMASDLCNLDANDSFGLETVNVVGTTRWNAAFAYLDPVRDSGRLRILDRTLVDRLVTTDAGVLVHGSRASAPIELLAGTLVLSAGVYGTPAILQRSGIGDPERLRSAGIEPVLELPGVGANLHDHPMVHSDRVIGPELQGYLDEAEASGFLPEEQTLGKALSTFATDGLFDLHLFPVCWSTQTSLLKGRVAIEVACMTPRSRGRCDVVGADPALAPRIDHAYLSDLEGHDLAVLRDGLRLADEILDHPTLAPLLGARVTDVSSDDAIRAEVVHYYHPVGTCAMGDVCDADGRVRGLPGVVVADVSLMPQIPRANTNLPAVMIGERIAAQLS